MNSTLTTGQVQLIKAGTLGRIRFFHPAHNAMPGHLLKALTSAIEQAGTDEQLRVLILESEGERTFCAGASFDELASLKDLESGVEFFSGFARVINAMRKCPKFILGRVQGKAIGGGVGLAAATDYCAATANAAVKLSELAVGIGPFVVGPAVERKIGKAAFSQLAIDASTWQNADWAMRNGLFQSVLPDIPSLDEHLMELARTLGSSSAEAMRQLKAALWEDAAHWDTLLSQRAAISGELILSPFAKNAIAAFKQK
jgi:methylglutaconyl-CoA hydratase